MTTSDERPPSAEKSRKAAGEVNPLDRIVGFQLRRAQLKTFNELIRLFDKLDLKPPQFAVLKVLETHPGINQTRAAKMLAIKRTNFVTLVDGLEQRGLAERRVSAKDRRGRPLFLTEAGTKLMAKAGSIQAKHERDLMHRLGGAEELETFLRLLHRLIAGTNADE
ncbi:MarR family winged helix-turn-helix transcriptional regulator [Aquamicrobium zhengzhouense]|uniref:Winged helix-turn-helix transcriptional regulator n=1 Tax=Aquamicrobium zhengzhouense TaxID=2781738 RepID=A0ABS0SD45_9HYPH|nr:MarR family winged helix-turn-helix transcriptional regulator [Aquamicrobium zhengzhouense]MBI1621223.1 winged helix-turn-helix transcriptional regulator [Aquamicrobium zhengzhouense]